MKLCLLMGILLSCSYALAQAETTLRADLNHASINELMHVKGMTRVWAERIIRFRPYRTKTDLVQQGVVPSDVYARIRDGVVAHRER